MGPLLLLSLVLLDFVGVHYNPPDISFQSNGTYLNDGAFVGSRSAVAELLELLSMHGPSFVLSLEFNWKSVKFSGHQGIDLSQHFL